MVPALKFLSGAVCILLAARAAPAQTLSDGALVKALRQGGYVIVMRHASSPREVPAGQTERQLDETGRTTATAMGKALRELKIPIGDVFTSPTYRALETIRLAQLANPKPTPELGDNGQSMRGGTEVQAAWLREKVTQFPVGADTLIVTHLPNLTDAFPKLAAGMADGEALVFASDGKGGARNVARVKIEDWPKMKN
jgi:phosphohistidine phosphatase SixA